MHVREAAKAPLQTGANRQYDTFPEPSEADRTAEGTAANPGVRRSCFTFISRNHTVLSLWYAARSDAPAVYPGCGCCCLDVGDLSRRHRLFVFFFTVVASFAATLQTSVMMSGSWEDTLWVSAISVCVVVPLTCLLRGALPALSSRLGLSSGRCSVVRTEEFALLALVALVVLHAADYAGVADVVTASEDFIFTWVAMMLIELLALAVLYPYLKCCCCCCMAKEYEHYQEVA